MVLTPIHQMVACNPCEASIPLWGRKFRHLVLELRGASLASHSLRLTWLITSLISPDAVYHRYNTVPRHLTQQRHQLFQCTRLLKVTIPRKWKTTCEGSWSSMQIQVSSRMASRVRLHNKVGICCANSLLGLIHPCLNIFRFFEPNRIHFASRFLKFNLPFLRREYVAILRNGSIS